MNLFLGQEKAVEQLFDAYSKREKIIDFKAPTGAGKTFIAASLISKIIENKRQDEKIVFVIATLSSSGLPKQFEIKLNEYKKFLKNNYTIELKESPSKSSNKVKDYEPTILAEDCKVILLGKSSFGKGRLLTEMGAFDKFIDQIKSENYKLVYIRDEAHIGLIEKNGLITVEKSQKATEEQQLHDCADFVVRMTATPTGKSKQIIIKEKDLMNDERSLLKTKDIFNKNIKSLNKSEIDDNDLLEIAMNEFIDVKKSYSASASGINPAALIQISSLGPNLSKEKLKSRIDEYKKIIESKGLTWATYFGDDKDSSTKEDLSLQKISEHNSSIDVVIFKVGPATGWDIPRACMLVQLRDISSDTLNQQTLGRIKRNPIPGLFINEFSNKYYVYSNYQEPSRDLYQYTLQDKYDSLRIPIIKGVAIDSNQKRVLSDMKEALNKWFSDNTHSIISRFSEEFVLNRTSVAFSKRRYVDSQSNAAQTKVEHVVYNAIEMHIEIHKEIEKIQHQWNLMKDVIEDAFISTKAIIPKITKTQYFFLIITHFKEQILKVFAENYADKVDFAYEVVENAKLRKNYMIWGNKGKTGEDGQLLVNFEDVKDEYAYVNTDESMKYMQALDSGPERIFMDHIIHYISKNPKVFDVWTKNPSLGNEVYLEYKNSIGNLSKAFIDFVFKKDNHFIYIEVKGHKDYDSEKTQNIIDAFSQYKKNLSTNELAKKLHFAIVVVDTDEYAKTRDLEKVNFKFRFYFDNITLTDWGNGKFELSDFFKIVIASHSG